MMTMNDENKENDTILMTEENDTGTVPENTISPADETSTPTRRTRRSQPVESTEPRRRRSRTAHQEVQNGPASNAPEEPEKIDSDAPENDDGIKSSLDNLIVQYENAAEEKGKTASTEEIIKAGERELRARNRLLARRRGRGRF